MSDEVFTHDFVLDQASNKTIILPVVKDDELELKVFSGLENMVVGKAFGIEEPVGESFKRLDEIDLIIVPGVAFDKMNNRLGRGKAYYDKLLKQTKAYKVGVCFDFQHIDHVPVDQFDVRMDLVIHD
jgi:5-formyltetrahydrofolate cyclo-ligase